MEKLFPTLMQHTLPDLEHKGTCLQLTDV